MIPNVSYFSLGLRGRLSKGKRILGRARRRPGGKPFFFLPRTRALVRLNYFALPFRRPATQTIFFLDSL